ncbi:hypothetical protein [Frigoriglobus tundricola]|uniref:Uncharacterized protein n=1 Tax=Frigoriglobus tundricola TaxID=2774151 RepID=A0A6M5YNE5_9BACT|nr:hypothetical protein [Frigoriglobus tundricola]QJW95629.1 hypothetical protein FTUN_3180 [Frigoriglobus tundricola]
MNPDRLATHLSVNSYGSFALTDAIRPGSGLPIRPRQGYRVEVYRDRRARLRLPMLSAAVSAERLFDTFLALLEPLGEMVHVVLESSHGTDTDGHADLRRSDIDRPVLASHFCEFEELLTHDGCTGVAVMADRVPMEVQFDEHKLLHVYAPDLKPFRRILRAHGVRRRKLLPLISEAEHLHHTTDDFADEFRQLALRVGVGDFDRVFSDEG